MTYSKWLLAGAGILALAACETADVGETEPAVAPAPPPVETAEAVEPAPAPESEAAPEAEPEAEAETPEVNSAELLQAILDAQPDEAKARYDARNPAETLAFFGIEPGMTVVEALPGRGWYTQILSPYLGAEGKLIAAQYPDDIWMRIIPGATEEGVAQFIAFNAGWKERTSQIAGENGPKLADYNMTTLGDDTEIGDVDAVLFIRALHNLGRVEADLGYMTKTIEETYRILKPGGLVGVVQHRGPDEASDEWANGDAGYLKQANVVAAFEAAGFVLEASSDINANPKDQPTEEDIVWRLAPSFGTTEEGTPEREAIAEIGESNRMTLRFRKPA